jgi:beta-mannosidase
VIRDLTVLADRVASDAVADNALVTLLPGESTTFTVRTTAQFNPDLLLARDVLRSANQLDD